MTKPKDYWVRHEHGGDRCSLETAHGLPRMPVTAILDNLRSAHNVGSAFRTSDGVGLGELLLCGYTPTPPHRHLSKTSLGAEEIVPWRHFDSVEDAISHARANDCQIIGMEVREGTVPLDEISLNFPVALVFGNEAEGLSPETCEQCDVIAHLPMHGHKSSLNVSVAFGIAVYELRRKWQAVGR